MFSLTLSVLDIIGSDKRSFTHRAQTTKTKLLQKDGVAVLIFMSHIYTTLKILVQGLL